MNFNDLKTKILTASRSAPVNIADAIAAAVSVRADAQDTYLKLDQALGPITSLAMEMDNDDIPVGVATKISDAEAQRLFYVFSDIISDLNGLTSLDQGGYKLQLLADESAMCLNFVSGSSYRDIGTFEIDCYDSDNELNPLINTYYDIATDSFYQKIWRSDILQLSNVPLVPEGVVQAIQSSRNSQEVLFNVVTGALNGSVTSVADLRALVPGANDDAIDALINTLSATGNNVNLKTLLLSFKNIYTALGSASASGSVYGFNEYSPVTSSLMRTIITSLGETVSQLLNTVLSFISPVLAVVSYAVTTIAGAIAQAYNKIKESTTTSTLNFMSVSGLLGIPILQGSYEVPIPSGKQPTDTMFNIFPWGLEEDLSCILVILPSMKVMIWRTGATLNVEAYLDLTHDTEKFWLTLRQELVSNGWDMRLADVPGADVFNSEHEVTIDYYVASNIVESWTSAMSAGLYADGLSEYAAYSEDRKALCIWKTLACALFVCVILKRWDNAQRDFTFHLPSASTNNKGLKMNSALYTGSGVYASIDAGSMIRGWIEDYLHPVIFYDMTPEELFTWVMSFTIGVDDGVACITSSPNVTTYYKQWQGVTKYIADFFGYNSAHNQGPTTPAYYLRRILSLGLQPMQDFPHGHNDSPAIVLLCPWNRGLDYVLPRDQYFTIPPETTEASFGATAAALVVAGAAIAATSAAGMMLFKRVAKRRATQLQQEVLDARTAYNAVNKSDSSAVAAAYKKYNKAYWKYSIYSGVTGSKGLATAGGVTPFSFGTGNGFSPSSELLGNAADALASSINNVSSSILGSDADMTLTDLASIVNTNFSNAGELLEYLVRLLANLS